MSEPVVTTRKIIEALREHYPRSKGWAVAEEVTGPDGRRADLFCWNTHTGRTVAIEVKASRGDAAREARDLSKSAGFRAQVDEWWIAGPASVLWGLQMPEGAGWLLFNQEGRLYQRTPGRRLGGRPSHELSNAFIRRLQADDTLQALLAEAEAVGEARGKNKVSRERPAATYTYQDIKNAERRGESAERRIWKAKLRKQEGKPA